MGIDRRYLCMWLLRRWVAKEFRVPAKPSGGFLHCTGIYIRRPRATLDHHMRHNELLHMPYELANENPDRGFI